MDQVTTVAGDKPTWRRIVDYPLVAMLIALALIAIGLVFSGLVGGLLQKLVVPANSGLKLDTLIEIIGIPVLVIVYKLSVSRLGEHPRDDLKDPNAVRRLLLGLLAGLLIFSVAVGVAAIMGVYTVTGEGDFTGLLAALVGSAIFPAVNEEIIFRGILFRWIEEWGGSWVALLLTSLFFGAAHLANPNASWIAAVGIAFEAGVMLGAAYMLTRSLWLPMGIHAAWNFTQGEIYDIPVSGTPVHGLLVARLSGPPLLTGNGFGLEASLIAIIVATLFGLWLLWLAIRKDEVIKPLWVRRRAEARPAP